MTKYIPSKSAFNFNKQILLAELGALIFAFLSAFIASNFFTGEAVISKFALGGTIFGAALFWISSRFIDNSRNNDYTSKDLLADMSYFTPVAFVLTMTIYYPPLYFLTKLFLGQYHTVLFSVVFAQTIACCLFLIGINIYRYALIKFFDKHI